MPRPLFTENVIALVWDFDRTLIPGHMQEPLFRRYGLDGNAFFNEANRLAEFYRAQDILAADVQYLNHILAHVRAGTLAGLSNAILRELGKELTFFPGTLDFFPRIQDMVRREPRYAKHDIRVEHYIASTGLRQIIRGSAVSPLVDKIWACEFSPGSPVPGFGDLPLSEIESDEIMCVSYVIDDTSKTRVIFEINKGINKEPSLHVNDFIPENERRVPFTNIVYIADGPSDIPVFSLVNKEHGKTFAVYEEKRRDLFDDVNLLREQGRVEAYAPADYREGSQADMWLTRAVELIAERIVAEHEARIASVGRSPGHRIDKVLEIPATSEQQTTSYPLPRTAIRELAEELLQRVGVTSAPVKLGPFLTELNIEVTERRSQKEPAILTPMSPPDEDIPSAWLVSMTSTREGARQRYTLAHEIGHVVLHPRAARTYASDPATKSRPHEREAQAFAAELLMPAFLMEPAVQDHGPNVATLARLFQVSKEAMEIRLRDLGVTPRLPNL